MKWANDESLIVVMIESQEGGDNIEEIVSTQEIDAVMIGPADLSQNIGVPGQLEHPRIEKSVQSVIKACEKHGVAPGIYIDNMDQAYKWMAAGMRFITYSYDFIFFMKASKEVLSKLHWKVEK